MFQKYAIDGVWDEIFLEPEKPRPEFASILEAIRTLDLSDYQRLQAAAENSQFRTGITFVVYGSKEGQEKIIPFDLMPRMITGKDWQKVEAGLIQRIRALNLFLDDIYNDQKILNDKIIPKELIFSAKTYREECRGLKPPQGIWIHITGTDLIRNRKGDFLVLEDNLRCPSGVSYVLENRDLVKRALPQLFDRFSVQPVQHYPDLLFEVLDHISPQHQDKHFGVLTPGVFNSAYFEHSFLARKMGVELVEGRDLVVDNDIVFLRTTKGFQPIDVLYRRIDDDFLDPETFRPDSLIGVPGLFQAYKKGNIALANAPGTGIADDKAVYAYVPDIIKYYLDEDPILSNVPTYLCSREKDLKYVLENLDQLVVKATNESGGYGMLMGHQSTNVQREDFARKIKADPRGFIAQPVIDLSQAPTLIGDHFEGRRVDLRPYVLYGKDVKVLPGGLTRVALTKDSLVVNSSQGGGSKDTWVLNDPERPTKSSSYGSGGTHA
jgi:uncharacterized circularly permuted ATP-grasp superfamily protein